MTTTINIDDSLLHDLTRLAAANGSSLDQFIVTTLREAVGSHPLKTTGQTGSLPAFDKGELQPGVEIHNNASVRRLLDSADDAYRR